MMWAIIKKEFLQLRRDPRLIALILVMPLLLLVLFGLALKLEPENMKMAYFDEDCSFFTMLIDTELGNDGYFNLYEVESLESLKEEIRAGRAKAGLHIKSDFSALLVENRQPHITFYVDGTMPSLTTAMKYNSKTVTSENITSQMYFLDANESNVVIAKTPFIMDTEILFNPEEKETWFFLPGVIGVLIMQIALILTGISVVREKEKNTLEQLFVTSISKMTFVIGKIVPYIIITMFDFYLILGVGWYLFELPFPDSQTALFLLAFIYISVMIALGFLISLISQTQQQAMFIAIFIIVPSILLSGFIFPLEAIPEYIRPISYIIPFTYFVEIIRGLLIKHTLLSDLFYDYLALVSFVIVFVSLSVVIFKKKL
ncbi:MAG: ABC transporter permease [Sulfurimonas sp.]|jgi:ABC-2 type transport system permease protein|nr:ABC transporter permease [Sulfurimonas sp.]